ncbi:MAG: DedA family protein [Holosporaceae bacterium]|nr:DedA family protein [Holosporaceae bacterium]
MFENFIQTYGYCAVFIFACIEGEIALLTAGFLCRHGIMSLRLVMLFAFLGTLITEQCMFFVGRNYGVKLLEKYPKLSKKARSVIEFLKRYNSAFIFGSRFVYGIRNISPLAIGMAEISPLRFSMLNIPAAFVWSVLVAGAGYLFADILESAKENLRYIQIGALATLCIALLYFLYGKSKKKGKRG